MMRGTLLALAQRGQPVDLAPETLDRVVDDLAHRLDLVDQAGAFAGGARSVLDIAVDVQRVDQVAARQPLALALAHVDGIGRAQTARAGPRRIVSHDRAGDGRGNDRVLVVDVDRAL